MNCVVYGQEVTLYSNCLIPSFKTTLSLHVADVGSEHGSSCRKNEESRIPCSD